MKKRKLRELQEQLRAGRQPVGEYTAPNTTLISMALPDGTSLGIRATEVTLEINRDFVGVETWTSPMKTYVVGPKTFTIKGKM